MISDLLRNVLCSHHLSVRPIQQNTSHNVYRSYICFGDILYLLVSVAIQSVFLLLALRVPNRCHWTSISHLPAVRITGRMFLEYGTTTVVHEVRLGGPVLPTGLVTGYCARAGGCGTALPYSSDLALSVLHEFGPVKKHLAGQTLTWSKLSPPDYRHLTPVSSAPAHKPWCQGGMSMVTTWRADMYYLLHMCHVHVRIIMRFSAPECLLPYFETDLYAVSNAKIINEQLIGRDV
jgi:hypothetical protein